MTNFVLRAAAVAAVATAVSASALGQGQAPQAPPPPVQAGSAFVAGQVLDADTGRGVAGALVALVPTRALQAQVTVRALGVAADSQGRFYFAGLAAGEYLTQSETAGYLSVNSTVTFSLADGERKTDLRLTLRKLSSMEGAVRDDTGAPAAGLDVLALRRTSLQGRPPALVAAARAKTNDRGEYRLIGLQPGEYYVCALSRDPIPFDGMLLSTLAARPVDLLAVAGRAAVAGADVASLEGTLRTLPPTFYPGTTLAARAERVRVGGGQALTSVDFVVTSTPAVRVSGRIVAPSAVHASFLRLTPEGDIPEASGITEIVPMLVQPDGRFDFANVPPGVYRLDVSLRAGLRAGGPSGAALTFIGARGTAMAPSVTPPPAQGGPGGASPALWASELITVGDRDVTGLVIALNPSLTVTGRIEFSGTAPPPTGPAQQRAFAQLMSIEAGQRQRTFTAPLQPDGTFSITGVIPGRYVLYPGITSPPWLTLKSMTAAGADILDTILTLDGRDLTEVVITLSDVPEATVSGRVALAASDTPGDIYVRIFPADRKFWQEPYGAFRRYRSARANNDGTYTVARVPAGEYFVAAAVGGGNEWMDPATLEAMARTAARVRVADGDKATVEVRR